MTFEHRPLFHAVLILAGLMTASWPRAAQPGHAESNRPVDRAIQVHHGLVLVCRIQDDGLYKAVMPYLRDLASVYGPEGLAVAVAGPAGDRNATQAGAPLRWLGDTHGNSVDHGDCAVIDSEGPGGDLWTSKKAVLVMCRRDGSILAAMEEAGLDLYAVYRICEGELRGRSRVSLAEHVGQVIEGQIMRGLMVETDGRSHDLFLADVLREYPGGCIFMPPGCSDCMLEKHAAALKNLFVDQERIAVLAFDPDAAEGLRRFGWRGVQYVLATDPESRLLGLRQAGNYAPLLVVWSERHGVKVRSIRSKGGA